MLREIASARQIPGEPPRRWFTDPVMDLVVWHKWDRIVGFQLSYDKQLNERAITWREDEQQLQHSRVDDGEGRSGKYKGSPLLTADGGYDAWHVCGKFLQVSKDVPGEIVQLVCETLLRGVGNR